MLPQLTIPSHILLSLASFPPHPQVVWLGTEPCEGGGLPVGSHGCGGSQPWTDVCPIPGRYHRATQGPPPQASESTCWHEAPCWAPGRAMTWREKQAADTPRSPFPIPCGSSMPAQHPAQTRLEPLFGAGTRCPLSRHFWPLQPPAKSSFLSGIPWPEGVGSGVLPASQAHHPITSLPGSSSPSLPLRSLSPPLLWPGSLGPPHLHFQI